ncbi:MAG: thioredoxin [Proteobacteria bacterium]|nr:thioredoxin [Pseudomonadota bacterium]
MIEPADGLIGVVKRDCPTCRLVVPVLAEIGAGGLPLTVLTQDDPAFPPGVAGVVGDTSLERSFHLAIETVPTLIRVEGGREVGRAVGWDRREWEALAGRKGLGAGLPESRPGCGALNVDPARADALALRFGAALLAARRIDLGPDEDELEACFARGWSDGLPVVPPTELRVWRMLQGTHRAPGEALGLVPPNLGPCTVEKVAINAVMAGCKPEYMPVVLAAVEAALEDRFCLHGLLATTQFAGPVVIVNGPVRKAIGMNWGVNCLGQGNRANATIGRALQLVVRNVGGGKPGGVDRAALGNPGKYTYCFAEDEDTPWEPLSVERGLAPGVSAVTVLSGDGLQPIIDQVSRTPGSLSRTYAACLRAVHHPKKSMPCDATLVIAPEHGRIFDDAGWSKARLRAELDELLMMPGEDLVAGAGGIEEGMPESARGKRLPKFRPGGLTIVRAGGRAGLFSAIIAAWAASGERGSQPVTKEVKA